MSPEFDISEDALMYIDDPVFGGYIDELGHATSHSSELWKRSLETSKKGRLDHISTETWRGNDVAEQFRAFLGHDMGIRGPDVSDMQSENAMGVASCNAQPLMQSMAT
jgi:hypothetical protein